MTPHELNLMILAYKESKKQDFEQQLTAAYLNAMWQRKDKLSSDDLKEVINKLNDEQPETKHKPKMTPEQMLNEVKKLNAAFGGDTY
jgi:hypothetical protein